MSQPPPGGSQPSGDPPDAGAPSGSSGPGSDATGHGSTGPIPTAPPSMAKNPPSGADPYGPPAGSTPPPTSYQQVPPGYQQGPPPGYQQGPPPGYQPGPPPGYQQGPPAGYQQPGYPPAGAYGPPGAAPGYPGAYPPAAGGPKPSFDMSKISIAGWGVLGASLLTLIASFFPFWSVTASGFIAFTVSLNGWSLWWWLPVLLAVAVGVIYALQLFGVLNPNQVKPEWLVYGAAASFVLMLGVLIQTFIYAGTALAGADGISHGPSFGVFLAIITTAALTYFMALAAQASGAKLPFKVPGPA